MNTIIDFVFKNPPYQPYRRVKVTIDEHWAANVQHYMYTFTIAEEGFIHTRIVNEPLRLMRQILVVYSNFSLGDPKFGWNDSWGENNFDRILREWDEYFGVYESFWNLIEGSI